MAARAIATATTKPKTPRNKNMKYILCSLCHCKLREARAGDGVITEEYCLKCGSDPCRELHGLDQYNQYYYYHQVRHFCMVQGCEICTSVDS